MRLKLISCDVFEREVQAAAARSSNRIEIEFLPKAPHQLSHNEMLRTLQSLVRRARRSRFHAVLMVAGSCKHGLSGLRAGSIPLVLPRLNNCISLLIERNAPAELPLTHCARGRGGRSLSGTTRASALRAPLPRQSTRDLLLTKTHVVPGRELVPVDSLAECSKWRAHLGQGTAAPSRRAQPPGSILQMLLEGYWNYSDFLVVPPGWQVVVNSEEGDINAQPLPP
jgi:hypothetical protein